jgi:diguanylate cyclase (GGDEF)-like protein
MLNFWPASGQRMLLDVPTLFTVSTCITALLGVFLLALWIQDRSVRALGWWAAAYLMGGFAVALWMLGPSLIPRSFDEIAPALLFVCCGMLWTGARRFHNRIPLYGAALAGAGVWLVAGAMPGFGSGGTGRVVLSSAIITVYAFLTAAELRRERRNPSHARLRAVLVPSLHAAVFLAPVFTMYAVPGGEPGFGPTSFALFSLLTLLYVVGTAFIVVVMAKERSELLHKTAAVTDPLTGVFNRRGLLEAAQRLIDAQAGKRQQVTVLMFDLDHFKSINDRFGHDGGDDALRVFAATAAGNMRATDILGRFGGEEFTAILPGGADSAVAVAERVRAAFEIAGETIAGHRMNATVSIGAAATHAQGAELAALMTRADAALYRAKQTGRNRVVAADASDEPAPEALAAIMVRAQVKREAKRVQPSGELATVS